MGGVAHGQRGREMHIAPGQAQWAGVWLPPSFILKP